MALHAAGGCARGPFTGEDGDFERDWRGTLLAKGEAIPGELGVEEAAGPGVGVVRGGEGGADGGGGGSVEEKESWNGEENDEEESGAEIEMRRGGDGLFRFGVESHIRKVCEYWESRECRNVLFFVIYGFAFMYLLC